MSLTEASIPVVADPSLNEEERLTSYDVWHWGTAERQGYYATMHLDVRHLPVFQSLSEEHAALLAPLAESFSCAAGNVIIQQGLKAEYVYIITRGRVEITYKPYDGNAITVTHADAGEVFGWSAVTGSRVYSSSAIAIEALEGIRMRGNQLRKLCRENPKAGREILNCLADAVGSRWKDAHNQVKAILSQGLK